MLTVQQPIQYGNELTTQQLNHINNETMHELGLFEKCSYGDGNRLVFSRLRQFERPKETKAHVSIKYVISGIENYQFNYKEHKVQDNKYLLINSGQVHATYLNSETDVTGVCLNLDTQLVNDVYNTLSTRSDKLLDYPILELKEPIDVFEDIYDAKNCPLGIILNQLAKNIDTFNPVNCTNELYYQLAEGLLLSQGIIRKKINNIKAQRSVTQNELYRRIEYGRKLIEERFYTQLNVEEVASAAAMSPFHFSRVFKQVYRLSPHQFLIHKRIDKAKELLKGDHFTVSEVAHQVGFADIYSFSKSFKKNCNISPTSFRVDFI